MMHILKVAVITYAIVLAAMFWLARESDPLAKAHWCGASGYFSKC